MVYVDSSGKTHVSLSEASRGSAAQRTASRDSSGAVVGQSSGSRYVQQQEEQARAAEEQKIRDTIKYNTDPAWKTAPGETSGIDRSQLQQFRTVDQINEERENGTIKRTISAFKQGYRAGEGKDYSLEGLKAPTVQAKDMITYSLYEKTNKLSEGYNSVQNAVLSKLPSGTFRDVVTGVTNVPEMAIGAAGGIPLGLESMARNPSSISDSISFGLGAMAGATVEKAKTHPGELTGELAGGVLLGKGMGSLSSKLKSPKIREIPIETTERQFSVIEGIEKTKIDTLGTPREYLKIKTRVAGEGELNPLDIKTADKYLGKDSRTFEVKYTKTSSLTDSSLNTEVRSGSGFAEVTLKKPSVLKAEQRTLSGDTLTQVDKGKWQADFSGLPKDKFSLNKQYSVENYLGKETFDYEFSTSVENIRARPVKEITQLRETPKELPKGAEQYFDVPKTPKQLDLFTDFGSNPESLASVQYRSLNLFPGEKPGFFAYDKIQFGKNSFKNTVRRLTSDETGSLVPVREPQVIPGGIKSELDIWKRDIILEELQPKTSIEIKTFELPRTYSSVSWGSSGALLSQVSNLKLGESTQDKVYTPSSVRFWSENAPQISVKSDVLEKSDVNLFTGSGNIFGTWEDTEQNTKQDSKQDIKPVVEVIPDLLPDILPDFPSDPVPSGNGWGDFIDVPFPQTKKKIPLSLDGDTLSIFSSGTIGTKRRKTKQKTVKNEYGDPFKIKLKL